MHKHNLNGCCEAFTARADFHFYLRILTAFQGAKTARRSVYGDLCLLGNDKDIFSIMCAQGARTGRLVHRLNFSCEYEDFIAGRRTVDADNSKQSQEYCGQSSNSQLPFW